MASNASSYFLYVESTKSGVVKGEATAKVATDQIELRSFEFEADRPFDMASGSPTGRIVYRAVKFEMPISIASPILLNIFMTNENIKTARIRCYRAGSDGKEACYLEWTFTNCSIISYHIANEERFPIDTFTLAYSKAEYDYYRLKPTGGSENARMVAWDGSIPANY